MTYKPIDKTKKLGNVHLGQFKESSFVSERICSLPGHDTTQQLISHLVSQAFFNINWTYISFVVELLRSLLYFWIFCCIDETQDENCYATLNSFHEFIARTKYVMKEYLS